MALQANLQAIKYSTGKLEILDQLQLPESCTYISINNVQDAWDAIRKMKVIFVQIAILIVM